jgi:hypothetical protein
MRFLKFLVIFCLLLFFIPQSVWASDLTTVKVSKVKEKQFAVNNQGFPYPPEITPLVITQQDGSKLYVLPTSRAHMCKTNGNLLNSSPDSPLKLSSDNCRLIAKPEILAGLNKDGGAIWKDPANVGDKDWQFNYDGVFGIHVLDDRLITIRQGEHQNLYYGGNYYQGRVFPEIDVHQCFSGYVDGHYEHCWESFAGFAFMEWLPYDSGSGWDKSNYQAWRDQGPIWWPQIPYKYSDGSRSGAGPYHTTSFKDDNYLYMYTISSQPPRPGAQCTTVARSPISSNGMPGTWKKYHSGSFSQPALPSGFSKEKMDDFYKTGGGKSECILKDRDSDLALYFNVAKIRNTPFYIAAEESQPKNQYWEMGVRLSTDLVNWTSPQILSRSDYTWGIDQKYSYPTFYDHEGKGNYEVWGGKFWLLGKAARNAKGYQLYGMQLKFPCSSLGTISGLTWQEVAGDQIKISWNNLSGAKFYSIRINDLTVGGSFNHADCESDTAEQGDICQNKVLTNSYTFQFTPGHEYDVWVHGRNMCANWGAQGLINFQTNANICNVCSTGLSKSKGNADCNNKIDLVDYAWWLSVFKSGSNKGVVDFNCQLEDSQFKVDLADFRVLLNNFSL